MDVKVPTADVLKRTARELDSLSIATRELERTVAEIVRSGTSRSAVVSLQSFDLVAQTLSALTEFVADVGDQIGTAHKTDIAQATHKIKLGDLRARLSSAEKFSAVSTPPEIF